MIEELIAANCIKQGEFTLKSGETSNCYFDMKNLISYPQTLKKLGDALYEKLGDFDIVCGIPYGGLPIAMYISTRYNKPLIYIRDKVKQYGTQNRIEGEFKKTDRCVVIDDVLTTGGSLQEALDFLHDKVQIVKCGVILDREQSTYNIDNLVHVFQKSEIAKKLEKK